MNQQAMELQKAIAVMLARGVAEPWERIVVNYEMQEEDGALTEDGGALPVPDSAADTAKRV